MTIIRRTLGLKPAAVQKPESVQVHPPPPQPVFRLREKETLAYFVASALTGLLSGCMPRTSIKDEEFNARSSEVDIDGERIESLCETAAKIGWRMFKEYKAIVRKAEAVTQLENKI
jgi:hypothetical protein